MNSAKVHSTRKRIYALLITLAAAAVAERLILAESFNQSSPAGTVLPAFGENDRSRWATIRTLAEQGTYCIGRRDRGTGEDTGLVFQPDYESVDKVLNQRTLEFFSSKPPLLPTLLAGEYWVLSRLGWTLGETPWVVVTLVIFTIHFVPLVIYLILLARLLESFGGSNWGRYYVLAAGCFATLVTHFAISLNNHVLATCLVMFALYPGLRIWLTPGGTAHGWSSRVAKWLGAGVGGPHAAASTPGRRLFLLAGFFAAFAACNELPALAFTVGLFVLLALWFPGRTLLYFVPAAALPIAAFFVTNYLAVGQLPPVQSQIHSSWYQYPGSYWNRSTGEEKHGIDRAALGETRAEYAFHVFLGHHGVFSLSPIFLLSAAGIMGGLFRGRRAKDQAQNEEEGGKRGLPWVVHLLGLYLSVVVSGFYLIMTSNYGGLASGMRWLMWLIPLWLLTMLPVADRLGTWHWGRILAYVLLAVSLFSVTYQPWNPWSDPWLYDLMKWLGWQGY